MNQEIALSQNGDRGQIGEKSCGNKMHKLDFYSNELLLETLLKGSFFIKFDLLTHLF